MGRDGSRKSARVDADSAQVDAQAEEFHCGSDGSLTFMVRKAWLSMRASIAQPLVEFNLTTSQYATLMMTQREPGMSVSDIARQVGSTRQAANEMLATLEKDGIIERRPHPTDRRTHQVYVTDAGRDLYERAHAAVSRREAELESAFTPAQRTAIREWLTGMAEACR
ncbi:MarR family winged helix-turn-helix transcriptional regulator [Nocardia seriolae]|uniref:MarR family transcriptional regulator n=1 Tax=Nocardia seriolae TaxID=37332 RepID=A0A0B8N943_9NOCA|nr:MarR family transcriptional regulator [Nocardia seriolae]APA98324.1 Multidrug resistance operon repressor [Nocardia seriolae]MTJ62998.1 MarR family transcriptional regulator [Nocardia seriolae]MTJ73740.1 MarR family transcriptional regulator [Nocardia seriolae]MTJ88025.1 MarR family transcriptional regulator [Nocardia seriolae]MTK32014.1 MarR family transcriptional regulator [Nocardia seriolae]